MKEIDIKQWHQFKISDIFETEIVGKKLQVPTGSYIAKKDLVDGNIPRITVSGVNNGITGYYSDEIENADYRIFENFISVSFLGTVFYQKGQASLDMKVHCLKPKNVNLNNYIAWFLVSVIRKVITYSTYNDQLSSTVLPNLIITLPSKLNEKGEYKPDWQCMEDYIKSIEKKVQFNSVQFSLSSKTEKGSINCQKWKYFHLYDIFNIDMGTKLDRVKMKTDNPSIDFVGRANAGQGVTTKVNKIDGLEPYKSGYLTLALGGAYLGSCFIQKNDFYTSQNVIVLIPKTEMSFRIKQFISTSIFVESQLHYKAFIDELNPHIKTDFQFKLPVDENGNPDWDYMKKYITYIEEKSKNRLKCLESI